jgi:protein-S-isoprenylcysteine O-methyltransferase Ste14
VIGWGFVGIQIVLLGVFVLSPGGDDWPLSNAVRTAARVSSLGGLIVVAIAAIGLGSSLTATPVPKERAIFRSSGLYRLVRHPIYSGVLAYVIGSTISSRSYWRLLFCVLIVVFFNVKARWEETQLRSTFPEYEAFAHRTPRFVPFLRSPDRPRLQNNRS